MSFLNVLLKLSPFLVSSSIFLFKYAKNSPIDSTYIVLKCIPILSLAFFVLSGLKSNNNKPYIKRILFGLVLSSVADVVICFEDYFLFAVGLFALVQVNYLTLFGFKPLRLDIAFVLILIQIGLSAYLIPFIQVNILKAILPCYMTLLFSMIWRSLSKVNFKSKGVDWPNLLGAFGSILFGCSDIILCYNAFAKELEYGNFAIMITYFYAQAGIALTILNKNDFKKKN